MSYHDETEGPKSYLVGYGKPPIHSQFKKGVSGNPAGRRKGTLNFSTVLTAALNEMVVVNENGRARKMSKLQILTKQLVNQAAKGDQRAISQITSLALSMEQNLDRNPSMPTGPNELDKKVIASLLERLDKSRKE